MGIFVLPFLFGEVHIADFVLDEVPDHIRETLTSRYEYVVAEKEVIPDLTDVIRLCDTCQEWCSK